MLVKSYIAIPHKGQKKQLKNAIRQFPACDVVPSENEDVLIVISETPDERADKQLYRQLNSLGELQMLSLVSSFSSQDEQTH